MARGWVVAVVVWCGAVVGTGAFSSSGRTPCAGSSNPFSSSSRACSKPMLKSRRRLPQQQEAAAKETEAEFDARVALLSRAGLIGIGTGVSVSAFKVSLIAVESVCEVLSKKQQMMLGEFAGGDLSTLPPGQILAYALVPAIGGCVVALLRRVTPGFDDAKTPNPIKSTNRVAASVATLGTGNSLGPEGTAVEIGRALAAGAGGASDTNKDARVLLGAGIAAGVAAGFSAPIAGIFFALETASKEKTSLPGVAVSATALASALSAYIATELFPQCRLELTTPEYIVGAYPLLQIPSYLGLGVVSSLVALSTQFAIARFKEAWANDGPFGSVVALELRPVIGGLFCGVIGIGCPQVLFNGYETLNSLLENDPDLTVATLLRLVTIKVVTTASCVGSGLVGGLFAPSLFLGATAGGAYGQVIGWTSDYLHTVLNNDLFDVAASPAYAAIGAASVLAALFQAPLTGAMLLFELTRSYDVILPLIASAGVASGVVNLVDARADTYAPFLFRPRPHKNDR